MKAATGFDLIALEINLEEKAALTALLYSGMTNGALQRMGLERLCERLSGCYNGPWQFDPNRDKVPTLETYGLTHEGNIIGGA